jgi:hypothetical protein
VEVVAGDEGLFFEGLADAGGGFRVSSSGEGAAEELQGVEVVGTLFELDGFGWRWGVEIGVDDGGEGGFALFFGLGNAVFEDRRDGAVGGGEDDVSDDGLLVVGCWLLVGGVGLEVERVELEVVFPLVAAP